MVKKVAINNAFFMFSTLSYHHDVPSAWRGLVMLLLLVCLFMVGTHDVGMVWPVSHCALWVNALSLFLGGVGLLCLSVSRDAELFFLHVALCSFAVCTSAVDTNKVTLYLLYVVMPCVFLNIYRNFLIQRPNSARILWTACYGALMIATLTGCHMCQEDGSFGWLHQARWLRLWVPGAAACLMGAVCLWTTALCADDLQEWLAFRPQYTGYYWCIIILELCTFLCEGAAQEVAMNLLCFSALPFLYGGMRRLLNYYQEKKPIRLLGALGGFFAIALALPVVCMILYELFTPWIQRKTFHGKD